MNEFAHGYAAMAPEDVADARRRRAERSLEPYAAARGLEFHGSGALAGFAQALPRFAEEQQQLMRGVLPGGRAGILLHALLQTHFRDQSSRIEMPGSFYGVVVKPPKGALRKALRPNRTWLPFVGQFLDDGIDDEDVPFGTHGAWSPITICAMPVPQTVAHLPHLVLRTRTRAPGRTGDHGDVGQLRVMGAEGDAVPAVLDGPPRELLAALAGPYWEVRVDFGLLTVQRNGFLVEDAALDDLCRRVCALADALADACAPATGPPPPGEPLPPPAWQADQRLATQPGMRDGWAPDAIRTAAERGLALEDPQLWHEHFSFLPVPGRAAVVLRDGADRILLCTDRPIPELRAVRPVLITAAPPGREATPPGGVAAPGARVFIGGGVAIVWSLEHRGYVGDALDHVPVLRAALQA
jgi:hypothetical protein